MQEDEREEKKGGGIATHLGKPVLRYCQTHQIEAGKGGSVRGEFLQKRNTERKNRIEENKTLGENFVR